MTFREAYCARFGVPPTSFEEEVLCQCVFTHARPLGRVLRRLRPGFFDADLELIRAVADCTTVGRMCVEMNTERYYGAPAADLWRGLLRVRLSGRRLLALGKKVLE